MSAAIIAQDEADRIADCLKSVSFADEIVVVDGGSLDETPDIAKSLGGSVIFNKWPGYAEQKQFAVDNCRNDWVMILDADERVSKEAAKEIEAIVSRPRSPYSAYGFYRKNFFHKRWFRRCGWWPDRVTRLVDRRKGRFSGHMVHEQWVSDGPVKDLEQHIEHHSFRSYADLIHKMQTYSTLAAKEMQKNGRRATWWSPISHGAWAFLRSYFLELGILEGFDGFVISLTNAGGSFMKYAKLRELILYR